MVFLQNASSYGISYELARRTHGHIPGADTVEREIKKTCFKLKTATGTSNQVFIVM